MMMLEKLTKWHEKAVYPATNQGGGSSNLSGRANKSEGLAEQG